VARLAIAKGFVTDYAKLDKGVRSAVQATIARFVEPAEGDLHLEEPQHSLDRRIRTVRVDSFWRGVVLAPESGDTFCLITVLPNDRAKAYATRHRFSVNQALGVLEVRDEEAIRQVQHSLQAIACPDDKRLFANVREADLTRLGVDAQILPLARLLTSEADLEALQAILPDAQYTALHALASGMTVEEAWTEVAESLPAGKLLEPVDPDDLISVIERTPDQVVFVSGQDELQRILAHPFAAWRTFLHPSQRKLAYRESYSGAAQVTGGPGTGKTVTALHRAAFLAARVNAPSAATQFGASGQGATARSFLKPILLTTFSGNLADTLGRQLDLLIQVIDVRERIEVLNVDRLAYGIVQQARGNPIIADERMLRIRWEEAADDVGLAFTPTFLKNEWEHVILAQDLRTEQAYLSCQRSGRGQPLSKAQRGHVWQATQRVTADLAAARQSTHLQLANEATHLLQHERRSCYRHIIVDEAQDLHPAQWRLLRAAVRPGPDDLFVAADPHQRIYDSRVSLASLGINVRGRSRRLSINYRTTQEILAWAVPLLGPDPTTGLDGEIDSLLGYRSPMHGRPPDSRIAATRTEEFALLTQRIRFWVDAGIEPHAIGVAARSASLAREVREALKVNGIMTVTLSNMQAVRVGTMYGMKGLEFQAVAVIGVEKDEVPALAAVTSASEDAVAHAQDLERERRLLFVACTRARDHLYVSGTGEPSYFLPKTEAVLPGSGPGNEVRPDLTDSPVSSPGPRKVTVRELLRMREDSWRPRLRGASLVAEADLRSDITDQVAVALGRQYGKLPDPRLQGESFLLQWPACLAAAMAGVAATRYQGGTYWPALWETAGLEGTAQDQGIWGRAFNTAIDRLGMATFPELPLHFVGPILMHAGIPTYCLGDYFRLLLSRRRHHPGMDAESFLAWATAPGRKLRLSELDVPARRFLTEGGDYALDVVDRSLDLLGRLADPNPDLDGIRLPARIVDAARREAMEQDLHKSASSRRQANGAGSRPRPCIALDPYGAGVQVILPAVGEAPDGVATWRVIVDGDPVTVRSRAHWVGSAESAPQTTHPLTRPVRAVRVSLVGWDHVSELDVVRPTDPVLFFSDDGRRLPPQLPLPPDHVWILRPADHELRAIGQLRTITETPAPFGWEGWCLQLVSLEDVHSLSLGAAPAHPVQGYTRPRLLLSSPIPGVTTPYGSPVYAEAPQLWLPSTPDSVVSWHVDVRRATGGPSLVSREVDQGVVGIWDELPRPLLGAFDITVRGPLGRGMRRTIFIAERVAVTYRPPVRGLRMGGLQPGAVKLEVPLGAAANPSQLTFRSSDRGRVVELRAGDETEPVVITPPHVELLCTGAGADAWTAAPIHAATEALGDLGRLLVRADGMAIKADLEVWAGAQRIQTIPPTGGQAAGLTGYDLARARQTVAHHGRAEFFLPWGEDAMPVGLVRPRRLASGAEINSGALRITDCAQVDGLSVGLYLARAPWRPPLILSVPDDGVVQLPSTVREAGPLRVLLRVEDPWTVTDWPQWPSGSSYACDAPGIPVSTDPEEGALSRFLAGEGDLPASPQKIDRLWNLIHLADDLIALGAPPNLRERCSVVLRGQPCRAITALLDTGLDSRACVVGLISSGLATARPLGDDHPVLDDRLWATIPDAAAVLYGRFLAEPVGVDGLSADLIDAALAECGPNLGAVLGGDGDPFVRVGQFGPEAEQMTALSPEQLEAVWQAAAVVPQTLLDADTRAVAARQMFDARRTPELVRAARDAASIIRAAEHRVTASPYRSVLTQIAGRRHPEGKGGWLALPAMSASLALVARVAARGDESCKSFERDWRSRWVDLARRAPEMTRIDLVLAEALLAGAERSRLAEVSA